MKTLILTISGMTCTGCERTVNRVIAQLPGVTETTVNYKTGQAEVKFDDNRISAEKIMDAVNDSGYKVTNHNLS
ncbi:MAG: heavy-metal-associated domain-containing protein [Bacteroidetes bacterium]|nr:heavy-metal-associated domain-containing protein [Bacteroidota bacterium]